MEIKNNQREKFLRVNEEADHLLTEAEYKIDEIVKKLEQYDGLGSYNLCCIKKNINKISYLLKRTSNINTILFDEIREGVITRKDK